MIECIIYVPKLGHGWRMILNDWKGDYWSLDDYKGSVKSCICVAEDKEVCLKFLG